MADFTFQLRAERWNDIVILHGTIANIDGDQANNGLLPTGLGDVAIMEAQVDVSSIATMATNPELMAVELNVSIPAVTQVDLVGISRFSKVQTTQLAAYVSPDPLVLWHQGEVLEVAFPELDTNGAPTADLTVRVKCVRVRPIESAARGPIRLVR